MTSRDFAYWLQGFFELQGTGPMTEEKVKKVAAHLDMVFAHEIDPSMGDSKHQEKLREIHHHHVNHVNPNDIRLMC